MNALELKNVTKRYEGFTLDNISFQLLQGTILGLVGENGAGKSTTIKLIMHAIRSDSGSIQVLGMDNGDAGFEQLKNDIGIVLDEAYFPEVLTAKQVGAVMQRTYKRWDGKSYQRYLDLLNLPDDKQFKDFSRGMKMKLAIAVALSHDPKLLILDEATSGLDPMVRDEILELFNEFTRQEDHTILLSSHIVSDLEKVCDYIAFLHEGELVLFEEKDRLLDEFALVKLPQEALQLISREAIVGLKRSAYGTEALVRRSMLPAGMQTEITSLEDIILFMAKGGEHA